MCIYIIGSLYPTGPVVRNFTRGDSLLLNVNVSDHSYFSIRSLVWYHNGTKITSRENGRLIIDRGATLSIANMEESDAGTYKVKINSTSFNFFNNSEFCDELVMPILELTAGHAPVTFTVQEQHTPTYDPSSNIVSTLYVSEETRYTQQLNGTSVISLRYIDFLVILWSRNGRELSENMFTNEELSLQLESRNVNDIVGDYIGTMWIAFSVFSLDFFIDSCYGYFDYLADQYFSFPISVFYWRIKVYGKSYPLLCQFSVSV